MGELLDSIVYIGLDLVYYGVKRVGKGRDEGAGQVSQFFRYNVQEARIVRPEILHITVYILLDLIKKVITDRISNL